MNDEIKVSICCATYNQEKCIEKTIEGFLNQKVNFKYEIIIHDDCSTDKTRDIIEKYRIQYPNLIRTIYQKENKYSKGEKITINYLFPNVQGKYVAVCEGDDYWNDENKLRIMYECLEKNKDCSFATHIVEKISKDGNCLHEFIPANYKIYSNEVNKIDIDDFFTVFSKKTLTPFQTSSYFFRSEYLYEYLNIKQFQTIPGVGDLPLVWYLMYKGKILFIKKNMSFYRTGDSNSWSAKLDDINYRINHFKNLITFLNFYDGYTNYRYETHIKYLIKKYNFEILRYSKNYKKIITGGYIDMLMLNIKPIIFELLWNKFKFFKLFYELYKKIK